jgi:1,4-dihydroxy-2-naphthoyl-CoA hydrolase
MSFPHALTVAELNVHSENSAAHHCGIKVVEIGDSWLVASMPIDHRTQGIDGKLNMGSLALLTESVGSLAAGLCVDRGRFACVGQLLEVTHLTDAKSGPVLARATPILLADDRHIWAINVSDHTGNAVALAKLSVAVISRDDPNTSAHSTQANAGVR